MLSMTRLREHSKKIYVLLLIFFVASLVLGGLMSGVDLVSLWSSNSKQNNAGQINDTSISDATYNNLVANQLNNIQAQNGNITAQDTVNALNTAWNILVQHELEKNKAAELNLITPESEIYKVLRNTPPTAFQQIFINGGLYIDDNGQFSLELYQNALDSNSIPDGFKIYFDQWGPIVDKYILRPRILQNIYSRISTVSDQEIKFEYLKNNVNCKIDYIFIKTNEIDEDLINVSTQEIKNEYNATRNEKYKVPERRTINYISFRITDSQNFDLLDSLNRNAYSFIDNADLTSFKATAEKFNYTINSLDIHEGFDNNSGFPFLMGTSRAAVRFIFDKEIGSISEPVKMNNEIIVIEITGDKAEGYKPFSEVEENIKKTLIREKKKEYAIEILNQQDWPNGNIDTSIVSILQNKEGIIRGRFDEIGTSNELVGTLLGLESGKTSKTISTYNTVCRVKMNSKDSFIKDHQAQYKEAYTTLKNQLTASKNRTNYQTWLNDKKENSNINDYRSEKY